MKLGIERVVPKKGVNSEWNLSEAEVGSNVVVNSNDPIF